MTIEIVRAERNENECYLIVFHNTHRKSSRDAYWEFCNISSFMLLFLHYIDFFLMFIFPYKQVYWTRWTIRFLLAWMWTSVTNGDKIYSLIPIYLYRHALGLGLRVLFCVLASVHNRVSSVHLIHISTGMTCTLHKVPPALSGPEILGDL